MWERRDMSASASSETVIWLYPPSSDTQWTSVWSECRYLFHWTRFKENLEGIIKIPHLFKKKLPLQEKPQSHRKYSVWPDTTNVKILTFGIQMSTKNLLGGQFMTKAIHRSLLFAARLKQKRFLDPQGPIWQCKILIFTRKPHFIPCRPFHSFSPIRCNSPKVTAHTCLGVQNHYSENIALQYVVLITIVFSSCKSEVERSCNVWMAVLVQGIKFIISNKYW